MAKFLLRKQAIELRLQGHTYSQIKDELGLAKSTLSDWLKNLPLTKDQFNLLLKNRDLSKDLQIERFRQTAKNKREQRFKKTLLKQREDLLPLSKKELFIAGIFLYWGEGSKQRGRVCISNTNPQVIQFALYWMTNVLEIPVEKLRILLHLYNDMDVIEETNFWSGSLGIDKKQFCPPYIKKSTRQSLSYKSFGHGTCNLMVFNTELSEKIAMSIKAIADVYGEKSESLWYN